VNPATAGEAATAVMPTKAEMQATAVTTEKAGKLLSLGMPTKKGSSATVSNRRKTINSKEENNSRTPGTPTAAKAWQQQGRQQ
jgi:hypothetical protein